MSMSNKKLIVCLLQAVLFFCMICVVCAGCKKDRAVSAAQKAADEEAAEEQGSSKKIVAVVFGYNFNADEYVQDALAAIVPEFGLEENGGIIRPLVYPQDFKDGSKTRISLLRNLLRGENVYGVVLLGAPENTNEVIADLREEGWRCPVYSFFPQDDILGMEYVSDFVVENSDPLLLVPADSVFGMIAEIIQLVQNKNPAERTDQLKTRIQKVAGAGWNVHFYTDTETGIRSSNHFIIERTMQPRVGTTQ